MLTEQSHRTIDHSPFCHSLFTSFRETPMYSVNYHRASSVADAAKLAKKGDAKLLSGGMMLIPAMKSRLASPSDLVDLGHIAALKGVKVSGKTITIGAGTTHADVAGDEKLKKA